MKIKKLDWKQEGENPDYIAKTLFDNLCYRVYRWRKEKSYEWQFYLDGGSALLEVLAYAPDDFSGFSCAQEAMDDAQKHWEELLMKFVE